MNPQPTIYVIWGLFEEKNILLEHYTQYERMLWGSIANNNMMDDIVTLFTAVVLWSHTTHGSHRGCAVKLKRFTVLCYAKINTPNLFRHKHRSSVPIDNMRFIRSAPPRLLFFYCSVATNVCTAWIHTRTLPSNMIAWATYLVSPIRFCLVIRGPCSVIFS